MPGPDTMQRFAETAEAIGATRSRLAKVSAAARWLAALRAEPLKIGTRYLGGRVFAGPDGRTLGFGGAAIGTVLRTLTGTSDEDMRAAWHRHADAGDVTFELYARSAPADGVPLLGVADAMNDISQASTTAKRAERMLALLQRCSALEAKYVMKLVTGDLRIGLSEGLVEAALSEAFSVPPDDVARAHMLTGDMGETAVLAAAKELHSAQPGLFAPIRFMLASAVADADEVIKRLGEDVWVEDKYDGIRCQLHCDGVRIALYSRDLRDISRQFPEISAGLRAVPAGTILDGEILAWKDERVLPFSALQTRLGRVSPTAAIMESVPVVYVAWDILMDDGAATLDEALRDRRKRLERLNLSGPFATAHVESAHDAADVDRLFDEVRARLNEGLMVKDPGSAYLPGRRGLFWLKLKRPIDTLDVVVVGAEWGHGKRRGVLSDVTFAVRRDDGELATIGKAYTGLTDREIVEMTQLLEELTITTHGRYHVVAPQIVLEIAFDSVQASSRHKSGYAMRFPRIVRWRTDKSVGDIDTITKVERLAAARLAAFNQTIDQA